uniref:potassium channel family protein n=1 Tax=uncultured Draconibacterium sp. TaxID=1573823 RepID=UPI0032172687
MFKILIIGFAIIAVNVFLQAIASMYLSKKTIHLLEEWKKEYSNFRILRLLSFSFMFLTLLHVLHALVWAISLYALPAIQSKFVRFSDIYYYSIVTFTTLGYGDITLHSAWRILSGIEAINGIMLIGWSTALMYNLIQNIYKIHRERDTNS